MKKELPREVFLSDCDDYGKFLKGIDASAARKPFFNRALRSFFDGEPLFSFLFNISSEWYAAGRPLRICRI